MQCHQLGASLQSCRPVVRRRVSLAPPRCTAASNLQTQQGSPSENFKELFTIIGGTAVQAGYLAAGCLAFDKVVPLILPAAALKAKTELFLGLMVVLSRFSYILSPFASRLTLTPPDFSFSEVLKGVQTGDRFKAQQFRLPTWLPELVTGWRLQMSVAALFIASCLDIGASLLVFEGLGQHLAAVPFFILAGQQALSDTMKLRVEDKSRITLKRFTACSLFVLFLQFARATLYFSIAPNAGLLLLPSLCCTCAWAALLCSFMQLNGAGSKVPRSGTRSSVKPAQDGTFDYVLWLLVRLEVLFWLAVLLLIVL